MMPLTLILRKANAGYVFKKHTLKDNHPLFLDDIKLHGKGESHVSSFDNTVYNFSDDIRKKIGQKIVWCVTLKVRYN